MPRPLIGKRREAGISYNSYAHVIPFGKRRAQWQNTFTTTEAVFGCRGPAYTDTTYPTNGRYTLVNGPTGTGSNTLLIHGGRTTWEGNIAYNDGHVSFETKANPDGITYRRTSGNPLAVPDNLFIDETNEQGGGATNDVSSRKNAFLRPIGGVTGTAPNFTIATWID